MCRAFLLRCARESQKTVAGVYSPPSLAWTQVVKYGREPTYHRAICQLSIFLTEFGAHQIVKTTGQQLWGSAMPASLRSGGIRGAHLLAKPCHGSCGSNSGICFRMADTSPTPFFNPKARFSSTSFFPPKNWEIDSTFPDFVAQCSCAPSLL